jgi:tetratricopeptide (TPR) repeat protein
MKAATFQKEAKSSEDYELAIKAYQEALLIAPWWPEAYYNLSVAQETAGKLDDAMRSLKLYILTGPRDAEEAENRLYALEAKKTMAEREAASPQALAAKRREKDEQLIKSLNGAIYVEGTLGDSEFRFHKEIQIVGNKAEYYAVIEYLSSQRQRDGPWLYVGKHHVWGHEGWFPLTGREFTNKYGNRYDISDDGTFISQKNPGGTEISRFQRRK